MSFIYEGLIMKPSRLAGFILTIPFFMILAIAMGVEIVITIIAILAVMVGVFMFLFGLCLILDD